MPENPAKLTTATTSRPSDAVTSKSPSNVVLCENPFAVESIDVELIKNIKKELLDEPECIIVENIVETDITFVKELKPVKKGWPTNPSKLNKIFRFRNMLFKSVLDLIISKKRNYFIYLGHPLFGASRTFVQKTLQLINDGYDFRTDNTLQQHLLHRIFNRLHNADYEIDYANKRNGFALVKSKLKMKLKLKKELQDSNYVEGNHAAVKENNSMCSNVRVKKEVCW